VTVAVLAIILELPDASCANHPWTPAILAKSSTTSLPFDALPVRLPYPLPSWQCFCERRRPCFSVRFLRDVLEQ